MQNIINFIHEEQAYIIIALVALVIILFIVCMIVFKCLNNLENKYRKFMRGVNNKNLEELIIGYLDKVDDAKQEAQEVKDKYNKLDERVKECIQKTAVIRYKAFEDVGSDLSFSIALLNENNNGVVITGIYGRNESTTYAKPIDKGISRYDLSDEEKLVLKNAIKNKD